MKAVIMAGGEGSRLRPLTCTLPKPMARIFGKPIIEYIFDLLSAHGTDGAAVTLGYLPHIIENAYEDGYGKLKLEFSREDEPLGTAGSVRKAAAEFKEPFVVISGDAMCDFDLTKIMEYHIARKAMITVVAVSQSDPREYGLIKTDGENRITGFIEKPAWSQSVTDLANTGVYIVDPECLKLIPRDKKYDFAADLFPLMLDRDMPIYCYHSEDYWCDIGSIEAYMKCQKDIFDGKMRLYGKSDSKKFLDTEEFDGVDYTVVPPVYIGADTDIAAGAVIGPYAVIDDNCSVGAGAKIRYSTVLENCWLGAGASVTGALVCSGAALKKGASMFENSVAGAGSVIGENASVSPNVLVWPGKVVGGGSNVNSNIKYGGMKREILSDGGVIGLGSFRLNPESCARIGGAIGSTYQGRKTGIANDGSKTASALHYAVVSGLLGTGASVWDFGECFESELKFLVNFCGLGSGIFVSGGEDSEVRICSEGGLSVTRSFERSIEAAMTKCEFKETGEQDMKEISDMSGMKLLYKQELMKQAPYGLRGMGVSVECENESIKNLMETVLKKSGAVSSSGITFEFDSSGTRAEATSDGVKYPHEKLLAICCLNEMKNGRDIAVPYDAPQFLDNLAHQQGRRVFRYLSSPADKSDSAARRLASRQVFVRDALFLAVKLLSVMKEREATLGELAEEIPEKVILRKKISLEFSPAELARAVGTSDFEGNCFEGVRIFRSSGRSLIIPERGGGSVRILAEADTMEAAQELCADVEDILNSVTENSDK